MLNLPERALLLRRDEVSALLAGAPGIAMPVTKRVTRPVLQQLADGDARACSVLENAPFPMIVRPVGSHAGKALSKMWVRQDLLGYLNVTAAQDFYISPFVDYRSSDGKYRKYRIVLIDGTPYVCHMAISEHWMVHYLNAGMSEHADRRVEEARFMATFGDFAARHRDALAAVDQRMGLNYVGIDCAEHALRRTARIRSGYGHDRARNGPDRHLPL